MQLPLFRRLTDEDISDAPQGKWKSKLLYALNLWFQQMYSGLSNQLTPEQNCIEQTKVFTLVGSSIPANNVYNFTTSYHYGPSFIESYVAVADSSTPIFTAAPYVSCTYANGVLSVLGISGLTDNVKYSVTVRIWWQQITNQ